MYERLHAFIMHRKLTNHFNPKWNFHGFPLVFTFSFNIYIYDHKLFPSYIGQETYKLGNC